MFRREFFVRFLLAMVSILFVIFLAEFFVRMFGVNYRVPLLSFQAFDSRLRFKNIANSRYIFSGSEFKADFFTNGQGFRNARETSLKTNKKRIMFLGDSFTFGFGVNLPEVSTSLIQKKFMAAGMDVEVVNAGNSGYGTDQELLYFTNIGIKYSPDIVVVNLYTNDIAENVWSSLFYLEAGKLKRNPEVVGYTAVAKARILLDKSRFFVWLTGRLHMLFGDNSRVWNSTNPYFGVLFAPENVLTGHLFSWPILRYSEAFNLKNWRPYVTSESFAKLTSPGELDFKYVVDLQRAIVAEMKIFFEENKIKFLFVLIPERRQCEDGFKYLDYFQVEMIKIFNEIDAPFIELRDKEMCNPSFYYKRDVHWNQMGHEAFARLMFSELTERYGLGATLR